MTDISLSAGSEFNEIKATGYTHSYYHLNAEDQINQLAFNNELIYTHCLQT